MLALFQSTPPCGGDSKCPKRHKGRVYFNPRPLAGATAVVSFQLFQGRFQSTPPCGGDQWSYGHIRGNLYFNPRPLAGATRCWKPGNNRPRNFNPRPLAGATAPGWPNTFYQSISIHAPLRGRLDARVSVLEQRVFQSTPPCGGDGAVPGKDRERPISIHAPLRGRLPSLIAQCGTLRFQSTPPCGGDCQTGQLEFYKRFRLFSRKSVHGSPKPHFPVLVPSVRFPFALTAPWELLGHRSFWLPGAGFCSDTCFPGCRTASCRGLCQ